MNFTREHFWRIWKYSVIRLLLPIWPSIHRWHRYSPNVTASDPATEHKSLEMPRWLYYFLQKSAQTEDANKIFQSLHRVLFASHTKTGHESLRGRQLVDLYWEFRWSWVWFSPLILGSVSLKHVPKMFSNGIIDASISLRKLDLPLCLLMGPVRFIFWNFCNVRSHWKWWVTYIGIL